MDTPSSLLLSLPHMDSNMTCLHPPKLLPHPSCAHFPRSRPQAWLIVVKRPPLFGLRGCPVPSGARLQQGLSDLVGRVLRSHLEWDARGRMATNNSIFQHIPPPPCIHTHSILTSAKIKLQNSLRKLQHSTGESAGFRNMQRPNSVRQAGKHVAERCGFPLPQSS